MTHYTDTDREALIPDRRAAFTTELMQGALCHSSTDHTKETWRTLLNEWGSPCSMYLDVEHKMWDAVLSYVAFV